jgi:hypothetical protein
LNTTADAACRVLGVTPACVNSRSAGQELATAAAGKGDASIAAASPAATDATVLAVAPAFLAAGK